MLRARLGELVAAARARGWSGLSVGEAVEARPGEVRAGARLAGARARSSRSCRSCGCCIAEVRGRRAGPPLTGPSTREVSERLRELSNRFRGARAVGVRREPVPAAYRVFFRQIGLDPTSVRTPIEAAVLERMLRGGFLGGGLLADVLLIALIDTGVPVWALDADSVDGPLGIRPSREGERLGRSRGPGLPPGGS